MNPSRRSLPDIHGGLSRRLQDAVGIAVLMTAVVAGAVVAASEALQEASGDVAVVTPQAVRAGAALGHAQ